jgi:hypothetical protein
MEAIPLFLSLSASCTGVLADRVRVLAWLKLSRRQRKILPEALNFRLWQKCPGEMAVFSAPGGRPHQVFIGGRQPSHAIGAKNPAKEKLRQSYGAKGLSQPTL